MKWLYLSIPTYSNTSIAIVLMQNIIFHDVFTSPEFILGIMSSRISGVFEKTVATVSRLMNAITKFSELQNLAIEIPKAVNDKYFPTAG
jgi:hypothetical protein